MPARHRILRRSNSSPENGPSLISQTIFASGLQRLYRETLNPGTLKRPESHIYRCLQLWWAGAPAQGGDLHGNGEARKRLRLFMMKNSSFVYVEYLRH